MMNAEYRGNAGCPQRDSAEHKEYVGAQSADNREVKEQDGADLLERILAGENLNRAYKRVKSNKGAPGIDGMSVEDALPWLREHSEGQERGRHLGAAQPWHKGHFRRSGNIGFITALPFPPGPEVRSP